MKAILNIFLFAGILVLFSCSDSGNYRKPPATGKIGDLVITIDKIYWDSELGDSARSVFYTPYPMLPQDEKSFNLLSVPYSAFNPSLQKHRNIIIVTVSNEYSEANIFTKHDTWASPQLIVNVVGPNEHSVAEILSKKKKILLDLFELAEQNRQAENAVTYVDPKITTAIENNFGVAMSVPDGYTILSTQKDFMWIESRTTHINYGIFVYEYPYTDEKTFTVDFQVKKRDELLKLYVPGQRDSSWMVTSRYIRPSFDVKEFKGQLYGEMRGLWEVENDYMGGPFVSRAYLDKKNKRIVTVEGYIYAPKLDKRDLLRRVDGIISTFRLEPGSSEIIKPEDSEKI